LRMKIFVSSEMNEAIDMERRQAARDEIGKIGHIPNCFEDLPGRRNPEDTDTREMCLELVRDSDLFLAIVDDTVTDIMDAEIKEALNSLGENRIFFYFTKHGHKDGEATALWNSVKKSWIIRQFENADQLTTEISRSIASFAGDVLKATSGAPKKLFDKTIDLGSGREILWKLTLKKGSTITITCASNSAFHKFKAGFYQREEFFRRKPTSIFNGFSFGRGSEKPHFTCKVKIAEDDDYYFVVHTGLYFGIAQIKVEVKVEAMPRP